MYALCLLRKNRSEFRARCSSTLTLFRTWMWVLRSFFNADAIIASSISNSWKSCCSTIDRDVISSSIDFAVPTSFGSRSIEIWGSVRQQQMKRNLSSESTLQNLLEKRCRKLEKLIQGVGSRIAILAKRSHLRSSPMTLCQEIASTEWFLKTEVEYQSRGSQHQRQHPR